MWDQLDYNGDRPTILDDFPAHCARYQLQHIAVNNQWCKGFDLPGIAHNVGCLLDSIPSLKKVILFDPSLDGSIREDSSLPDSSSDFSFNDGSDLEEGDSQECSATKLAQLKALLVSGEWNQSCDYPHAVHGDEGENNEDYCYSCGAIYDVVLKRLVMGGKKLE